MPEGKRSQLSETFMTIWIIVRVGLILVVWLALFLALFLGYFTVPIIIVIILSSLYTLTDAAFFVANRRQQQERERDEMLKERLSQKIDDGTV